MRDLLSDEFNEVSWKLIVDGMEALQQFSLVLLFCSRNWVAKGHAADWPGQQVSVCVCLGESATG